MMTLYFSPLACSLAVRIVALEADVSLNYRQVEVFAKTITSDGSKYEAIAPLELVPVLELDDERLTERLAERLTERLTEVSAIVQYLADLKPGGARLLPPVSTIERYRTLSWLSFVASELHKRIFWVLGNRDTPKEAKRYARSKLAPPAFDFLEKHLAGREYLATDQFTVADAYLAWIVSLAPFIGLELGERPALCHYAEQISRRPSVSQALAIEVPLLGDAMDRQRAFLGPPRNPE
jgi:glutathione S-transferase